MVMMHHTNETWHSFDLNAGGVVCIITELCRLPRTHLQPEYCERQ